MNDSSNNNHDIDQYLSDLSSEIKTKNERLLQRWGASSMFTGSFDSSPEINEENSTIVEIGSEIISETRMKLNFEGEAILLTDDIPSMKEELIKKF